MKEKIFTIIYQKSKEIKEFDCSYYSLQRTIDKFVTEGGEVLCVMTHKSNIKEKKPEDINKTQKQRLYNNKYSNYYKQFKKGKINESEFIKVKEVLKKLKDECKTSNEFEKKFLEYKNKKSTNNIPSYNVSD